MPEVVSENTRFNPDETPFHDMAKPWRGGSATPPTSSRTQQLAQLVRLRVAQVNQCSYCFILHGKTAREVGIDPAKADNLASWWESRLFSDAETAALAYCGALRRGNPPGFEKVHAPAAEHLSTIQIAERTAIVINMNVWPRLKLAQGPLPIDA